MRFADPLILIALAALSGCDWAPRKPERALPPANLIQDCPEPLELPSTLGELVLNRNDYRAVLRACNNDKAALREWAEKK